MNFEALLYSEIGLFARQQWSRTVGARKFFLRGIRMRNFGLLPRAYAKNPNVTCSFAVGMFSTKIFRFSLDFLLAFPENPRGFFGFPLVG
jgi:hypothetical protein